MRNKAVAAGAIALLVLIAAGIGKVILDILVEAISNG